MAQKLTITKATRTVMTFIGRIHDKLAKDDQTDQPVEGTKVPEAVTEPVEVVVVTEKETVQTVTTVTDDNEAQAALEEAAVADIKATALPPQVDATTEPAAAAKAPAKPRAKRPTKKEKEAAAKAEADRLEAEGAAKLAQSDARKAAEASRKLDEANAKKATAEAEMLREEAEALRVSTALDDAQAELIRSEARVKDVEADALRIALKKKLRKEGKEARQQKIAALKTKSALYGGRVWTFLKPKDKTGVSPGKSPASKLWGLTQSLSKGLWTGLTTGAHALGKAPSAWHSSREKALQRTIERERLKLQLDKEREERRKLRAASQQPSAPSPTQPSAQPANVRSVIEPVRVPNPFPKVGNARRETARKSWFRRAG